MYMAFGVALWGGFTFGSVSVINECFCKHYLNGKWRKHLERINMLF